MPIYEFQCSKCGKQFELLMSKMGKNLKAKCPECGGQAKQQLSCFGVGSSSSSSSSCPDGSCSLPGGICPTGTCPFT